VIVTMIGTLLFKQPLDFAAVIGILFIVAGVLILKGSLNNCNTFTANRLA